MTLRLNLGRYLREHNITAYRLAAEVRGRVSPNTVYSLARKPAQRIDLATVGELLGALTRVRGEQVQFADMLEDTPEPASPPLPPPALDAAKLSKKFQYSGSGTKIKLNSGTVAGLISEGREP